MFGTKKIYAKIMNGKLVVRVGGGYMVIEEFVDTYHDQELDKIEKMIERGEDPFANSSSPGSSPKTEKSRHSRY